MVLDFSLISRIRLDFRSANVQILKLVFEISFETTDFSHRIDNTNKKTL